MTPDVLSIQGLSVALADRSFLKILDDVSVRVAPGSIVGVVGGSGSGKTTLGLATLGIVSLAMRVASGQIYFEGQDVLRMPSAALRRIRGQRIGMIFQEPVSAFDPVFTIGQQIMETIRVHESVGGAGLQERVLSILEKVRVPDPKRIFNCWPHELSGGLRQRAMIAQAIACGPSLLIADEPTSSLDVTLQAHIMELFRDLRREMGLSILLISHDLGMVTRLADEIVVMSQGRVIEAGATGAVIADTKQPYTQRLIQAGGI